MTPTVQRVTRSVRRGAAAAGHRVGQALRDRGLVPASRDYTPFVIVCAGRSGSNMLVGLLQSHPGVVCYRESFHFARPSWGYDHLRYLNTPAHQRLRAANPAAFLDRLVFNAKPPSQEAVGFKLLYWHAEADRDAWRAAVLPAVLSVPGLRVIHLVRANKLAVAASSKQATEDQVWVVEKGGRVGSRPRVHLEPQKVERKFARLRQMETTYRAALATVPVLEITYEGLVSDTGAEMATVERHLGLSPWTYEAQTERTGGRTLSERIENYDALKAHFSGSESAVYFTD